MSDTVVVRKENKNHIRQLMSDGNEHTLYDMMEKSGLSVATVNSILAELVDEGSLLREKRQLNGVGRATWIYRINPEFDSVLLVKILPKEEKVVFTNEYSYGALIRCFEVKEKNNFTNAVLNVLENTKGKISSVVISVPAHTGINNFFATGIMNKTGIPTEFHDEIYYYAINETNVKKITYVDFSFNMQPVITNVFDGKIVTENSPLLFPEIGAFKTEMEKDELIKLTVRYLRLIMCVYQPEEIIFGGSVIKEDDFEMLRSEISHYRYHPEFSLLNNAEGKIVKGMAKLALKIRKL